MPVTDLKEVGNGTIVGLYHISEDYESLLDILAPNELDREILDSYSNIQKREEWLSARILLRAVCEKLDLEYFGTRKDSNGKPFLQGHALEISLSHSFPYVAVIANPQNEVGIDLEQPRIKLRRIATRFLDQRELNICNDHLESLCTFWCAKEAIYKIYSKKGLHFREEIHLYPSGEFRWSEIQGIISRGQEEKHYTLRCEYGDDYIMVYNI